MTDTLAFASATELAAKIRGKEVSAVELTEHYIKRIEHYDRDINAVVVRRFEQAVQEARDADRALARGNPRGPLHGVPMTIKESYVMNGTAATWGIPGQRDNVADHDGLIVQRFKAAGAHFLGKTNVPLDLGDFQSYNDIYGTTNNPYNLEHTPGGSSGGSSAAMAAGFSALEAGSDIGGSIRTPAVFCGVYGHKPTWGIVPLAGHELIAGVPDPDVSVCGPLARSAEDLQLALDIMAGPTEREALGWQLQLAPPEVSSLSGLRVAVWATDPLAPVDEEIETAATRLGATLERLGARVSYSARPEFDLLKSHHTYLSLMNATMASGQPASEIARIQAYVDQLAEDNQSSDAVTARAAVMSHRQWIRHNLRREKLRRAWDAFFADWDVLICPQQVTTAFKHDHRPVAERSLLVNGEQRGYSDGLFWSGLANSSYLPSTAFPAGMSSSGLPIGLQATCASYLDRRAIEIARLITLETGGFTPPTRLEPQP